MNMQPQQNPPGNPVEVQGYQEPSAESQEVVALFADMEKNQFTFLNDAGKSLIERTSTFLAILLGLSVLGNSFQSVYLTGYILARVLIIFTLLCYLSAMGAAMWAIQPHSYRHYLNNTSALARERDKITRHKMRWLRVSGFFFLFGSVALAALIIAIVWKITQ